MLRGNILAITANIKQTAIIRKISLATKLSLKLPQSIIVFFISIIGPNIKNPKIEPVVN